MTHQPNAELLDALRAADPAVEITLPPSDALVAVKHARQPRLPLMWRATSPSTAAADERHEQQIAHLAPMLRRYFARRLAADAAADRTSETLRAIWKQRALLPQPGQEQRRWAYEIAHRTLLRHGANRHRAPVGEPENTQASLPDEAFIAAVALSLLDSRDQELLRLVCWEDLTVSDAGRLLGLRPGAAPVRYSRAHERLVEVYDTLARA